MSRPTMFKNLKLQEKYSMWLKEVFNAIEVDSKTGKYVVLKTVDSVGDMFWFLGKSGAIRINRTNTSTTSFDTQKRIETKFVEWCHTKLKGEITNEC